MRPDCLTSARNRHHQPWEKKYFSCGCCLEVTKKTFQYAGARIWGLRGTDSSRLRRIAPPSPFCRPGPAPDPQPHRQASTTTHGCTWCDLGKPQHLACRCARSPCPAPARSARARRAATGRQYHATAAPAAIWASFSTGPASAHTSTSQERQSKARGIMPAATPRLRLVRSEQASAPGLPLRQPYPAQRPPAVPERGARPQACSVTPWLRLARSGQAVRPNQTASTTP